MLRSRLRIDSVAAYSVADQVVPRRLERERLLPLDAGDDAAVGRLVHSPPSLMTLACGCCMGGAQVVADKTTSLLAMGASCLWPPLSLHRNALDCSSCSSAGFSGGQLSSGPSVGEVSPGGLAMPALDDLGTRQAGEGIRLLPLAVTDGTACSGGMSLSLMQRFQVLQAVEVDDDRVTDLRHNIQLMLDASDEGAAARLLTYHGDYVALSCGLLQVLQKNRAPVVFRLVYALRICSEHAGPALPCSLPDAAARLVLFQLLISTVARGALRVAGHCGPGPPVGRAHVYGPSAHGRHDVG